MALPNEWEREEHILYPRLFPPPLRPLTHNDIIYIREDDGSWPEFSTFLKNYSIGHLFGLKIGVLFLHEIDEQITFNGCLINDPHSSFTEKS